MSWVNAWALVGLGAVALPILIHMMGRAPARERRFPSLRFLDASRLLPSRRTKLQDPLLLLVRALVLVLAALALAGPVFNRLPPTPDESRLALAVVVDTSATVARARSGDGVTLAMSKADSAVARASTSSVVATAHPGQAIAGAAAWLGTQPGRREIVIVSDFQLGAIDSLDLNALAPGISVSFVRLSADTTQSALDLRTAQGEEFVTARILRVGASADVSWQRAGSSVDAGIEILGSAAEKSDGALASRASRVIGRNVRGGPDKRSVAIVYPGYPQRAELFRVAGALTSPWQGEMAARVATDSLVVAAAADERASGDSLDAPATVIVRGADNRALISVVGGSDRLLFFVHAGAASITSVALHAALARARAGDVNAAELEPRTMSNATLAQLTAPRVADAASTTAPARPLDSPVTRMLWIAALVLLALEWLLRRRVSASRSVEATSVVG